MRKRAPGRTRPAARAVVEWRDGVHLVGTPLWCDAARARDACFVSSAELHEARRHKQIIATEATLALLPEVRGGGSAPLALAVPYGRPFTLGDARLELFPSGAMAGAASLLVVEGERRVVYAGALGPRPAAREVRAAETLVLRTSFGHPRFRFAPPETTLAEIAAWAAAAATDGAIPVLLAAPFTTGPALLTGLAAQMPVRAHRSFVDVARKLRGLGHALPEVRRFDGTPAPGDAVLWPIGLRDAAALAALKNARLALCSGLACDPASVAKLRVDAAAAFALGEHADFEGLLAYVAETGARSVFVVGGGAEALVGELRARGLVASALGPPEQLRLDLAR